MEEYQIEIIRNTSFHELTQAQREEMKDWFSTEEEFLDLQNLFVGVQSYKQASEKERNLNFIFSTPVAFRQGAFDNVLPTRESLFNSLLNRWHKYSGIELTNISFESIYASAFNINTEVISNYDNKFIGCLGEISYRILGNAETTTIKQINALADFALYAGIGRKTTMGMGMVRRR
jgi:CRISPR-associated endoribonuclease Cas6